MLPSRRACLPSVSGAAHCVRRERALQSAHVVLKRSIFPHSSTLSIPRTMHTSQYDSPQTTSPASNKRWKRGRPVIFKGQIVRPVHNGLGTYEDDSRIKPVEASYVQTVEVSAAEGGQPPFPQDSSEPFLFAPANPTRATLSTAATTHSEFNLQHALDIESNSIETRPEVWVTNTTTHGTALKPDCTKASARMGRKTVSNKTVDAGTQTTKVESQDSEYVDDEVDQDEFQQDSDTQSEIDEEYVPFVTLVPLAYQIPHKALSTTQQAPPNTRASFYNTALYRGPQGETVSVHYCRNMEVADRVARHFLNEKVLGFDIEWKPWCNPYSIKQNVSLIQIASEDRIALFHISLFPGKTAEELMPPNLKTILESPHITKVGVAVKGDFKRVEKFLGIKPQGVFELSRLHNLVEWYATDPDLVSNKLVGLAAQVLQHLLLPLYKGTPLDDEPEVTSSVRKSNWSKPLNFKQIQYAAADAYAGFRLYHVLEWKRERLRPVPPPIQLCDYDSVSMSKSKEPRERAKSAAKKEPVPADATVATEQPEFKDSGDSEDPEEYETASEEAIDNPQLEAPAQLSMQKIGRGTNKIMVQPSPGAAPDLKSHDDVLDYEKTPSQKWVGRISLSWIPGPDPDYPILPQISSEISSRSSSQGSDAKSDEFADSELEEALNNLALDSEGELREVEHKQASRPSPITEAQSESTRTNEAAKADVDVKSIPSLPHRILPSDTAPSSPYIDATAWAQTYLQSTIPSPMSKSPSRIRATVPHLRAYHLWAYQKLSLDDIAKQLRDPPLAMSTVSGYIAQAISLEKLDYDQDALKAVMMTMPSAARQGRFKRLSEKVDSLE